MPVGCFKPAAKLLWMLLFTKMASKLLGICKWILNLRPEICNCDMKQRKIENGTKWNNGPVWNEELGAAQTVDNSSLALTLIWPRFARFGPHPCQIRVRFCCHLRKIKLTIILTTVCWEWGRMSLSIPVTCWEGPWGNMIKYHGNGPSDANTKGQQGL